MKKMRKILGYFSVSKEGHTIGKLDDGRFAVDLVHLNKDVTSRKVFDCLDSAFDFWFSQVVSKMQTALISGKQ